MEAWCEHIENNDCHYAGRSGNSYGQRADEWSFCPICGAKRPEAPKTLAEVLGRALGIDIDFVKDNCGDRAALAWFKAKVEKANNFHLAYGFKNYLLAELEKEREL